MEKDLERDLKNLSITEMNEKAENAVAVAVAAAAATGAVPIPFADAPLLIGEQVALMLKICSIYGMDIKKDGLKMLATTALSAGGAAVVGKTVATNLLKIIPGVGTAVGGVVSAGTAGLVTLAMGKAFIEVCKMVKLGKLSESDVCSATGAAIMKEQFKKEIKKNKDCDFQNMQNESSVVTGNEISSIETLCIGETIAFGMVVEDVFTITGRGTVATGTIEKGTVKEGDKIELRKNDGTKKVAEIRGIEQNKNIVSSAGVGDTVGLLLKGIIRSDIERGDIIVIVQS